MVSSAGRELSLASLWNIVRRRKFYVLIPAVLLSIGAGVYAFRRPVLYRAQALIGVQTNARDYIQHPEVTRVQDQLLTIREVLLGRPVLEPVMENYRLYPAANGKVSDQDLEKMRDNVKITVEGDDSFHVSYEGRDRTATMNITNEIANRFIQRLAGMRERQVTTASSTVDSELERLRNELNEQEAKVTKYKERAVNELPDRLETNLKMYETTQIEMQSSSTAKANDEARLAAVTTEMGELEKQGVLKPPEPKERSPLEIKLEDAKLHLKQLRTVYTDKFPEIASTEREIQDLEKAIAAAPPRPVDAEPSMSRMRYSQLKAEKESLEKRLASYAQEQRSLQSQIGTLQARVSSTPQHEVAISELTRGYEATKARYNELLAKQEQARLASNLERANETMSFKIVEPASLPAGPSTPRRGRLLLMGLLAAICVGLGCAFVAEQMDTTFGTVAEFQSYTDMPVLGALPGLAVESPTATVKGTVPLLPTGGSDVKPALLSYAKLHENHIVALTDPESIPAEQYRVLSLKIRRQLQTPLQLNQNEVPILAVCSFVGGEGKTVTAMNLSLTLATTVSGRVLLIDSDLRKPRVHEYLGMDPRQSLGFSDLLVTPEDELGKYLWKLKDLYVMPGGSNLKNPVGLLASKNTRVVMDRLRSEFDFIVIDSPPILPVVDSHIIAGLADGVLMVVRSRYTRREMIDLGLSNFQGAHILGAAINDVDYQGTSYAYAYQYYKRQYAGTNQGA